MRLGGGRRGRLWVKGSGREGARETDGQAKLGREEYYSKCLTPTLAERGLGVAGMGSLRLQKSPSGHAGSQRGGEGAEPGKQLGKIIKDAPCSLGEGCAVVYEEWGGGRG